MWCNYSTAGNVLPCRPPKTVRLAWQAEDALSQDVLVDLGGTALNGVGAAAEHSPYFVGQGGAVISQFAEPGGRRHTEDLGGHQLDALIEASLMDLANRTL